MGRIFKELYRSFFGGGEQWDVGEAFFASRSIVRKRPSGLYSRVTSKVLSTVLGRSPFTQITYSISTDANLVAIFNRVAAIDAISVPTVIQSVVRTINCASDSFNVSKGTYSILVNLSERSPSVTTKINSSLRGQLKSSSRTSRLKTNSRKLVFNCTYGRAPRLVPLPVVLTRELTGGITRLQGSKRLPCLEPSKGARIAIRCTSNRIGEVRTIIVTYRRSRSISRRQVERSVLQVIVPTIVPTRLLSSRAGCFIGTAKITEPISIHIRAFRATDLSRRLVRRLVGGRFSLHPTTVVHSFSLQGPVCEGLTYCNRFNEPRLSLP